MQKKKDVFINFLTGLWNLLIQEYKRIQVHYERVFAPDGTVLINREYIRSGQIKEEYVMNEKNDSALHITYFGNGRISTPPR